MIGGAELLQLSAERTSLVLRPLDFSLGSRGRGQRRLPFDFFPSAGSNSVLLIGSRYKHRRWRHVGQNGQEHKGKNRLRDKFTGRKGTRAVARLLRRCEASRCKILCEGTRNRFQTLVVIPCFFISIRFDVCQLPIRLLHRGSC